MASRKTQTTPHDHPASRGKPLGYDAMVALAKRVTDATDAPVVGGVAVMLHGGPRNTVDIDIYSVDFWQTHERLVAAGMLWDNKRREHLIDGVPIHMVKDDSLGGPPHRVSVIKGVRVIGLADVIRGKLTVGLKQTHRHKDLAHVIDLIIAVPLKKDFAARLPKELRAPFKELVEQVHGKRGNPVPRVSPKDYFAKYGSAARRAAI